MIPHFSRHDSGIGIPNENDSALRWAELMTIVLILCTKTFIRFSLSAVKKIACSI